MGIKNSSPVLDHNDSLSLIGGEEFPVRPALHLPLSQWFFRVFVSSQLKQERRCQCVYFVILFHTPLCSAIKQERVGRRDGVKSGLTSLSS